MKQKWTDVTDEPMTMDVIRSMHLPEESFKLDEETHQPGKSFIVKAGDDFILYVMSGVCKTTVNGMLLQLSGGEFIFLAKGAYQFKSTGAEDVRLVKAMSRS